jgi:gamma-glutamyltranspeptidase/glutathione hydrolase
MRSRPTLARSAVGFVLAALTIAPRASADEAAQFRGGMVVSVSREASLAGRDVLAHGGNAVDAAVATALALAVTYPPAGNLGGGGFMLVFPGDGRAPECIEYRETAPAAVRAETYLHDVSHLGPRMVGTPGTIRGLALAHVRYGKLPWRDVVQPAIHLADQGFPLDAPLAASLNEVLAESQEFPEFRRVYGKSGGAEPWQAGDVLTLPELRDSLRLLSEEGPDAFYLGRIARQIEAEMQAGWGYLSAADLAAYRACVRRPTHGEFRGYDIYGPPPPSSGGIALVQMLNLLEPHDLRTSGPLAPDNVHLLIEAMRRAFADRARYLGDPDFVAIPERLTSKEYAEEIGAGIDLGRATPSASLTPEITIDGESPSTTHFSVVDAQGMAVSNTYTLEESYGSRVVVRGAGFLLNNELGDFNWRPGQTDTSGRIGTAANVAAPGKRMLSSQTPVVVARDGKAVLVTGSPGGRTIINTVLQVVLNVCEHRLPLDQAVAAPRWHHQWFPDQVRFEAVDRPEQAPLLEELRRRGHVVDAKAEPQGDAHSIAIGPGGTLIGAADPRISGYAAGLERPPASR